jgi:hypothetical protein
MYKFYESLLLYRGLPIAYGCAELNERGKREKESAATEDFILFLFKKKSDINNNMTVGILAGIPDRATFKSFFAYTCEK